MRFANIEHVDIGAIVQLVSAQLPHPNDRETGLHPPPLPIPMHRNPELGA